MNSPEHTKKIFLVIENINSNHLGIYFSLFLHFLILLFAIGLPDFFKPKTITLPNIIPIEIINVTETTSVVKKEKQNQKKNIEKKIIKQKKFNASENVEIKKIETQTQPEIIKKEIPEINTKKEIIVKEKIDQKKIIENKINKVENIESINTQKIKPKIKPRPTNNNLKSISSDVQSIPKPQPKPEPEFSIATMLKDLRNEESNNMQDIDKEKTEDILTSEDKENDETSMILSISEIDLLRQQLSSCWNAPAGAVIDKGMSVTISAKIRQNRRVIENSVRIIDTNIAKSNTFYGPITESAMRTLLNPECTPLKLPSDKYNLWKNLTITFDYSIMKGYSG